MGHHSQADFLKDKRTHGPPTLLCFFITMAPLIAYHRALDTQNLILEILRTL